MKIVNAISYLENSTASSFSMQNITHDTHSELLNFLNPHSLIEWEEKETSPHLVDLISTKAFKIFALQLIEPAFALTLSFLRSHELMQLECSNSRFKGICHQFLAQLHIIMPNQEKNFSLFLQNIKTPLRIQSLTYSTLCINSLPLLREKCPHLKALQLKEHSAVDSFFLSNLEGLHLEEFRISGEFSDTAFFYLKNMPIKKLFLHHCYSLTNQGLAYLKYLPLEELSLEGSFQITNEGIYYLQDLSITKLSLNGCSISDSDLRLLERTPLSELDLSHCSLLTNDIHLFLKKDLIKKINLSFCKGLTEEGIAALKDSLRPECSIVSVFG